ncbi:glucosaminidase domain-containing protein [Agrilactobacillus yilanensis]|uniref:Peptidoglycan hydrolase n=1 Tax=Agrilactobacillus yilanensis TaxID=2485997 RepID=A0ABW4J493_9LACO|nr:glucosaminidase domain-containing protein [Agrilactobacillus yilanensis]
MQTRQQRILETRLKQRQDRRQKTTVAASLLGISSSLGIGSFVTTQQVTLANADVSQSGDMNGVTDMSGIVSEQTTTTISAENIQASNGYGDTAFLQALGQEARQLAADNDLYASVMVAQALLESNWGTSDLASSPNYNLFGVKGSYQGDSVNYNTLEDDGSGRLYSIKSNFKKYPSYKASLEDYVYLLKHGITSNVTFYSGTFKSNTNSYLDATQWLTGRYATDTQYADKLNQIIQSYHLTQFDGPEMVNYTVKSGDSLWAIAQNTDTDYYQLLSVNNLVATTNIMPGQILKVKAPLQQLAAPQQATITSINQPNQHRVVVTAKDSLAKIAKANDVSVAELKAKNHLKSDLILVGQKLVIR